jgi:hypothetical protein
MSTDLNPKQRRAARRVRQALSYVGEPERRVILVALKEWFEAAMAPMLADLEWRIAKEDALALAMEERLGHEPQDGEEITPSDEQRAEQILEMYPRIDT